MARPRRKKLKFDEDSVNGLLQEIYDESHNIRAQIRTLFIKWEKNVKEAGEVAAIGDQIVKLILAQAKNQDQKIMLLKYLKEVVFEKDKNPKNSNDNDKQEITKEDRMAMLNKVTNDIQNISKKN